MAPDQVIQLTAQLQTLLLILGGASFCLGVVVAIAVLSYIDRSADKPLPGAMTRQLVAERDALDAWYRSQLRRNVSAEMLVVKRLDRLHELLRLPPFDLRVQEAK